MRLRFLTAARREAEAAARWYEDRESGLGTRFVAEIERATKLIVEAPKLWPEYSGDPRARRMPLSRFPYSVVFVIRSDEVIVVAIAHAKRRPGYWQKRFG